MERADKEVRSEPHRKIEYDLGYWGGDYSDVGDFAYVPESLVARHDDVGAAFEAFTGHDRRHIVCTYEDEHVDAFGNEIED